MMPCTEEQTVYDFLYEKYPQGKPPKLRVRRASSMKNPEPQEDTIDPNSSPSGSDGFWKLWTDTLDMSPIPSDAQFAELIIPTVDTARYTYLLDIAIRHKQEILFVGPTGTGKSVYIQQHLMRGLPQEDYLLNFVAFSARTSANS